MNIIKRHDDGRVISRKRIIGTDVVIYEAWEPSSTTGPHGTIAQAEGQWYGRIGTRAVPAELFAAVPAHALDAERSAIVREFYQSEYARAYALIGIEGQRALGEIVSIEPEEATVPA